MRDSQTTFGDKSRSNARESVRIRLADCGRRFVRASSYRGTLLCPMIT